MLINSPPITLIDWLGNSRWHYNRYPKYDTQRWPVFRYPADGRVFGVARPFCVQSWRLTHPRPTPHTPYTWAEKFESFERINSIRETNGNFDSCNSCKRLGTSRLHELHESKFPFVSRIKFILSKLSNFSADVYGVTDALWPAAPDQTAAAGRSIDGPSAVSRSDDGSEDPSQSVQTDSPNSAALRETWTPDTWAEKIGSLERMNSIREINGIEVTWVTASVCFTYRIYPF